MLSTISKLPTLLNALNPAAVSDLVEATDVSEISVGADRFRVHRAENLAFVSDSCEYHGADAVFPIHPESLLLSLLIPNSSGGRFLDVGCGSGILPIVAASRGWHATAIDINPRALEFARCSSILSTSSVELVQADVRSFQANPRFDFISLNLPFEPTAGIAKNFQHSDGGHLGHELSVAAAKRLPDLLLSAGIAVLLCFSVQREGASELEKELENFVSLGLEVTLIRLSSDISLRTLTPRYGSALGAEVERTLNRAGYSSFFIELAVFEKSVTPQALQVLDARIAGADWVYPLGEHSLTVIA